MKALVLSAGGFYAAYQAGAWRVLAERFRPDLIVGASAGALNGCAIAGGIGPDELAARWLDPATAGIMRFHPTRRGLFDPAPLAALANELMDRYPPRIPFATTVVEVPSFRLRLVAPGRVDARAIQASCSVIACYPPVRIDGRLCTDGGLLGALPLWAAAQLGATEVLAINCLPVMPSWLIRNSLKLLRRLRNPPRPRAGMKVSVVAPSGALGPLRESYRWSPDRIAAWIAKGEADARIYRSSNVNDAQ